MKTITYMFLSIALAGTLLLMSQMTATGGHVGKSMIENVVADVIPKVSNAVTAQHQNRAIACDHLALSGYVCDQCNDPKALQPIPVA